MVVPVLLPQSLDLYITWLAILKAGAAFCPLNIDAPTERIEFILQDVSATVVVTQNALASRMPLGASATIIKTDGLEAGDRDIMATARNIPSSNLAYIMYTSGSTGRPKGVGISHLAATQSLLAHNDLIPQFDRFLQFASPTFDVSVFEVFFPFMRGATLIGSDREQMLLDISHVMTKMQVDAAELTPTVAGELLRTRAAAPSLKVLLTIGEMLTKHVVEEFGESETSAGILHGMYGPTEAAIHCTAATHFSSSSAVNLIGRPFQTVSAFIMSLAPEDKSVPHELKPLALGEIGELVVGGPQLADGYINRPEENAKAFIQSAQYGRLYRTGDKARMLPSGEIECFGRISSGQVKLRGQRIELGEIEHAICRAPEVRSAVAIVSGGNLASYVLVNDKATTDRELRDICRQWLPRFMIPGEFILVDRFPQLPSGKIDRKALEADFANRPASSPSREGNQCRDELEETISSCVADILGRQLSPDESLVSSGLDSLAAIRLASHLLDAGIRLDVAQVLDADCISGLWRTSKDLEAMGPTEDSQAGLRRIYQLVSDAGSARIDSLGLSSQVADIEPCSHIQQAMILETVRDGKAYCNWIEVEFQPTISSDALKSALIMVANRNPLLCSGFVEIGLKDHSFARFVWKSLNEESIQRCSTFNYELDLMDDNDLLHPLRAQIKESNEGVQLLIHIHHALYDGWSWQLILKDLYRVLLKQDIAPKPSYDAVTKFLIDYKLSDSAKDSSLFWRDSLQGLSAAPFPNFHGRTDIAPSAKEAIRELDLSILKLNELSQSLQVGRQTILQAAFCYVLSTYLGSNDVSFGTVFSGRTLPVKGIESIIGPCIRTLPTRMNLNKMQSASDLLLAIQNSNRKSLEHGILPLQDIKKASGIDFRQQLFDTAVVWQESIWDEEQNSLFREVANGEFLELALLLEFEPRGGKVHAKATYQSSLLPAAQANLLLEQIDLVATILIDSPMLSIHEIGSFLPSSVLSVSNPRPETCVNRSSLATGVEAIASVDPDRTAVEALLPGGNICGADSIQTLSYGQLNSRANHFAHHLASKGVTKNDLIAIFPNRSIDSCVSMLALAKIGTGVLPLAANAPSQTINAILAAMSPRFLVADELTQSDSELLSSVSKISPPDSSSRYPDDNLLTVHDTFHIVCAGTASLDNGVTKHSCFSHHSIQSHINAITASYPMSPDSKLLQSAPPPSAASVIEPFLTWHVGMTLCLAPDARLASNISSVVNRLGITHLHITPTLASRLTPDDVPSVRFLFVSGEPISAKVHRDWAGRGLSQGFESFGVGGVSTVHPHVNTTTTTENIGPPLKNTSVLVAAPGEDVRLLLHGAVGELYFGGDQIGNMLSRAEDGGIRRFVDHPAFGWLYKSGDYGRLLPDGTVTLIPRHDQAGRHSHFLVFEDLDRALISSEVVQDARSVVLGSSSSDEQQLAAVWVPSSKLQVDEVSDESLAHYTQSIFEELAQKLPSASIPSFLLPVAEIPMTARYKFDYTKIRDDFQKMSPERLELFSYHPQADVASENFSQEEVLMSKALSVVTGVDHRHIGRDTSFFRLGLDSLSAISFSRKLQESGLGRVPVSTILQQSSLSQLSTVISAQVNVHSLSSNKEPCRAFSFEESFLQEIRQAFNTHDTSVEGVHPCTPLQEAMLAVDAEAGLAYYNHLLFRVNKDIRVLKSSWNQMTERHEILRTCFQPTNDKRFVFAQVVLNQVSLPWTGVGTSTERVMMDIKETKAAFEKKSPTDGTLPYALTHFVDTDTHDSHLLLSIHHALYDGEGIGQLLQELQLSLSGHSLPDTVPFHRFIDYMVSNDSEESDDFWSRYLSGISPLRLSIDAGDAPNSQVASSQVHLQLPKSLSLLKKKCKDASSAPLNVFHAAWARLLALASGSNDICFGNVFSCRTIPLEGVDTIVGPCFNTLPMRIKFSPTSTNTDIMKLSQMHNNEILPHQLSPLRRIQRHVLNSNSQLFDTLVVFQSNAAQLDAQYWELLEDEGYMGFPFVCEVVPDATKDRVSIYLHYKTSQLNHQLVESLGQKFLRLVDHTIEYPYAQAYKAGSSGTDSPLLFEKIPLRENAIKTSPVNTLAWSHQEEVLREILCGLSGCNAESVSLDTTIFQLGLDSINAVQLAGKLRGLGYKVSTGDILEAASVEKIAALLETQANGIYEDTFDFVGFEKRHLQSVCDNLGITQENVQSLRPCTPVQNGMLALFTHSNGNAYFNRMSLNPSAPLDSTLLRQAWMKVATRHQMLRTGFVQLSDQQYPFAMITYQPSTELPWHEQLDSESHEMDHPERRALENLHQPPWEITVKKSSTGVTTVIFSALHALYDAQSLESIFSDSIAVYKGETLAEPASIDATLGPILIESQKQSQSGQQFWQRMTSEIQPSKFPDLHPTHTKERTLLSNSVLFSKPLKELEASCQHIGVTLQAAGQAAWARLLSAYTGEHKVTFGTVLSGRNLSTEAQTAVFPCLVTVPSPHSIEGTNRELLSRTLKTNAVLTKNQFAPLAQIQRWLGSDEPLFDTLRLLENTVFEPDSDSNDYMFLGNHLLSITPAKEKTLPTSVSFLHQFVEEKAREIPDKIAFEFVSSIDSDSLQKQTWSYREFNEDGNRIAHYLQSKGVTPGGMVAISFDKCPEASLAILGILKAGCAYLAIDPSAPISRKQFILEDSNSKIILCDQTRKTELDGLSGVDVLTLDEPGVFEGFPSSQPSLTRNIQPNDTCYCLYTSGTTGTPKGCEITHDNAVQAMLAFQRLFEPHWDDDSRWLQFASFHFDVSVLEQYWSWSVGICVTSCPRDLLFEDLPGTIQRLQITHIDLTPSLARLVHPDEVPSLCRGVFITGGEALKQEILDAWGKHGVIYNGYGPTEVTIGCTMLPRMRANDKPSNIGPQFLNVGSYVFRPGTSTPVLRGGVGELCVSGPLVGKGYLNRAELTRERFQELPDYKDRIYRTGDLVRILHDETFQFLGRIDDQVKLRGQRLEIGEINEVIKQATSEVNEVATLVLRHPKQSKDQLVSFFTKVDVDKKSRPVEILFSGENRTLLSTVKVACQTHLPGYMVPTHIILLTRFPLSPNNKADMKVLKGLYHGLSLEDIQQLALLTVRETAENVRENEIIAALESFTDPTVASMSLALQESTNAPLSMDNLYRNAQQDIQAFSHKHFHSLLETLGSEDSEIAGIALLRSTIDLERLKSSWAHVQSEVQMLRARFLPTPDGYAQVIMKSDDLPWSQIETSSSERVQSLTQKGTDAWISGLGGLSGPLWQVTVVRSPETTIMCLNIFHALYDGNSLALLLDLVTQSYLQHDTGSQAPQFLDVLHKGPLCKNPAAESFWKSHLANLSIRPLPREKTRRVPFEKEIQIKSTKSLDFLRNTLKVTEQAVLHACWLLALHRHFHFVPPVGIVASGRTIDVPRASDVIGPLFNTIPSNVQLHGNYSWKEVAQRCHEYHVSTIPFQHTALRDIVKWLGKSSDEPLFETLFVFQRDVSDKKASLGNLWTWVSSDAEHDYPLAFEITRNGDNNMRAVLATKADIMSMESAQGLLSHFEQILNDFAQNPDQGLPYLNGVDHADPGANDEMKDTSTSSQPDTEFQWSALASKIRDAIATLAGVDTGSVTESTSIFEVGLDSIDAIKLSSRLSKSGIKLPVSTIMRNRTVKAMSSQLYTEEGDYSNSTSPLLSSMEQSLTRFLEKESLLPEGAVRVLPATPIQEAMVAEMNASAFKHYYNHEILQIESHVDLARLQAAWKSAVKAHPILRTSFVEIVVPNGASLQSFIEEKRADAITHNSSHPLFSLTFVVDGDSRYLILSISHALYDGWSINLLHEDVLKSYSGENCTRPSSDPILEQVLSSSGERSLKFWRAALSGCKPAVFPSGGDYEEGSEVVHRAEKRFSTSLEKAEGFCKKMGVTMQALLVSCWSLLLATRVRQLDVVFGLVLSGRNVADSENMMFPTMNTIAMRAILHGTRVDLVKYLQDRLLEISEHQHFPLRRARPDTRSGPLFDTLFIYQKRPAEADEPSQPLYRATGDGVSGVEYPVCAEVEVVGKDLIGRVACQGSLLGESGTLELLEQMAHILTSVMDEPNHQTVDFLADSLDICGYSVSHERTNGVEPTPPSEKHSPSEWSPTESAIRSVLAVASGVPDETIEKDDTIFQLGLDSISAIKVVALLKKQSVTLTVSDMLKAGTVAKMAVLANRARAEVSQADMSKALEDSLQGIETDSLLRSYGIEPYQAQNVIATTAGQSYFLAMNALNPEVFYPTFYYKAVKQLSPDILTDAWSFLVKQTPVLRTAFLPTNQAHLPYIQVVLRAVQPLIQWHQDADQMIRGVDIKQEFGKVPVALHACETPEGTALALKIHHALYDAVSLPQILDRLAQLYDSIESGSEFNAEPTNDISRLVALQNIASPMKIGPIQQFYRPGLVSKMSRVEIAAKRHGLSIQSIFLAVYARLHARILGETESEPLVVGLYLANRAQVAEDADALVPTVNIVPLRLDNKLSDDHESLTTAARGIQHDIGLISAVEHASVSLTEIAEWTGVRISTCVNFLRLPTTEDSSGGPGATGAGLRPVQSVDLTGTNSNLVRNVSALEPVPQAHEPAQAGIGDVFLPTIDIEAAVRKDRLDFGLFAPRGRLESATAERVIEGMCQEMGILTQEFP
ncbi:hypothetical protein N7470_001472 [Penicillium chermesinum]|nr:hypothetical protein N7470_001472 [Penicillium chermesinum]